MFGVVVAVGLETGEDGPGLGNFLAIFGSFKLIIVFSSSGCGSTHLSVTLNITSSNKLLITL